MEAIPLCLLLNKLHLIGRKQHRYILIQIVPVYLCYMLRPVLRPLHLVCSANISGAYKVRVILLC